MINKVRYLLMHTVKKIMNPIKLKISNRVKMGTWTPLWEPTIEPLNLMVTMTYRGIARDQIHNLLCELVPRPDTQLCAYLGDTG
jgi:hypothetical protein